MTDLGPYAAYVHMRDAPSEIRPSAEPLPLEQKEKPLGAVFLAAIYDDLDDLYET